jgi:hypothetical protein
MIGIGATAQDFDINDFDEQVSEPESTLTDAKIQNGVESGLPVKRVEYLLALSRVNRLKCCFSGRLNYIYIRMHFGIHAVMRRANNEPTIGRVPLAPAYFKSYLNVHVHRNLTKNTQPSRRPSKV